MISSKELFPVLIVAVAVLIFNSCAENKTNPTSPIFSDVEVIEITRPDSGGSLGTTGFIWDVPDEVEYMVLGIFSSVIQVSGKTIINMDKCYGGGRTGLAGFERGQLLTSNIHQYDQNTGDFNPALSAGILSPSYWAVWGYDKYMNLTHASPCYTVIP
jgi:hypothetical protein